MSKAGMILKRFREFVQDGEDSTPTIRVLLADHGDGTYQRLDEGKWIDGRFPKGIRLDQPTHMQGVGAVHGHVYGRKGQELVVVEFDGTAATVRRAPASGRSEALRAHGFKIRNDRVVEWWLAPNPEGLQLILE